MIKVVLTAMLMTGIAFVSRGELITNGDFEAGAWSGGGSGSGSGGWSGAAPVLELSGGSDGGQWTRFDTTPISEPFWWGWSAIWTDDSAPGAAGDVFEISGMAQHISDGNTLHAFVEYKDATGARVDYDGNGVVDNNPDRFHLTWATVPGWTAFSDTFTVPAVDLLGAPFASPITQFNVTFSVETERGAVGIDQLSLVVVPEPTTIGLLGLGLGVLFFRRRIR